MQSSLKRTFTTLLATTYIAAMLAVPTLSVIEALQPKPKEYVAEKSIDDKFDDYKKKLETEKENKSIPMISEDKDKLFRYDKKIAKKLKSLHPKRLKPGISDKEIGFLEPIASTGIKKDFYYKLGHFDVWQNNEWSFSKTISKEDYIIGNYDFKDFIHDFNSSQYSLDDFVNVLATERLSEVSEKIAQSEAFKARYTQKIDIEIPNDLKRFILVGNQCKSFDELREKLNTFHFEGIIDSIKRDIVPYFKYALAEKELSQKYAHSDDILKTLIETKTGDCDIVNTYFVALMRQLNIPARLAYGYRSNQGSFTNLRHAWSEIFHPLKGWVIVDATPHSNHTLRKIPVVSNEYKETEKISDGKYCFKEFEYLSKLISNATPQQTKERINKFNILHSELFPNKKIKDEVMGIIADFALIEKNSELKHNKSLAALMLNIYSAEHSQEATLAALMLNIHSAEHSREDRLPELYRAVSKDSSDIIRSANFIIDEKGINRNYGSMLYDMIKDLVKKKLDVGFIRKVLECSSMSFYRPGDYGEDAKADLVTLFEQLPEKERERYFMSNYSRGGIAFYFNLFADTLDRNFYNNLIAPKIISDEKKDSLKRIKSVESCIKQYKNIPDLLAFGFTSFVDFENSIDDLAIILSSDSYNPEHLGNELDNIARTYFEARKDIKAKLNENSNYYPKFIQLDTLFNLYTLPSAKEYVAKIISEEAELNKHGYSYSIKTNKDLALNFLETAQNDLAKLSYWNISSCVECQDKIDVLKEVIGIVSDMYGQEHTDFTF